METTPDKHCLWEVHLDHLEDALGQIHKHGSSVIAVTPHTLADTGGPLPKIQVESYLIIYYNPPMETIPGMTGGGDPATIQ